MLFIGKSFGDSLRNLFTGLALLPIFVLSAAAAFVLPPSQSVELAWNPSTDPTVAGYMLSYGTSTTNLDSEIDAGTNTSVEVTGLVSGQTNYFVIAAYNAQGVLGVPSGTIACAASTGTISQQTGGLEITLNADGAQWALDGGGWQESGAILSGVTAGSHTITFSALDGWIAPSAETISVNSGETNTVTAMYVSAPDMGGLMVALNIPEAQWSVDNGAWQNTEAIVSGLPAGSHTVTFSEVAGWTAPASETITVAVDQTNSITANYVVMPQTGGLQVTLNATGARWSVDGGVMQASGAIVSGLSAGSHIVAFGSVSGWTTPASQTVSIVANQTDSISGTYVVVQTGSLRVSLNVSGAQWCVDNGSWQKSGGTVSGISVGTHTVTFNAVDGYTTPASQTITVAANRTKLDSATYVVVPATGGLEVTLNITDAQWSVDGGAWQNSGVTVSGLSAGSHTITFSVMDSWSTPASQVVSVVANQTYSIAATYVVVPETGALQVTLSPAVAQWSVDNGAWQNSGAIVAGLPVGSHAITFSAMDGWTTPASQVVSVVANQTDSIAATYVVVPETGALQVMLSPAVAQWSVDNGAWQNSGAIVTGLSVGSHSVAFSAMAGWARPVGQSVSIVANQTNAISATYIAIPQTGALQVSVDPAAAQWCVDNGSWQSSAAIVSGLSVGSHTIAFSAMDGWTSPVSQNVSIVANQTNSIAATYVVGTSTGNLQVTLTPAGAQWAVDNGTWQNSGAVVSNLSAGSHAISFSAMSGWARPFDQAIYIEANQTSSITAAYVAIPQTGALQVHLSPVAAQWCVDNGSWQNSGAIVSRLSVGSHTIAFGSMNGWAAPAPRTITIVGNETNVVVAAYKSTIPMGSLAILLNVPGAQWSVDGGFWQQSGHWVTNLSGGSHALAFSAVSNWLAPSNKVVSIIANQTNWITATYIAISQTVTVAGPTGTILARGDASLLAERQKKRSASGALGAAYQRNSTASFQPKRLVEMAGTYNGLFYPAKGVTQETSGMLSGLIVNINGTYSGKILLHGSSLVVSGSFDANGHSCQFLSRSRRLGGPLKVDMTLSWNGNQPGILGTVCGIDEAPWTANLVADPAASSELSYQSTILFPPAANAPAGFGSATIINDGGSAMVVGKLADGKRFSQHVTVSADGSAPFYVYLGENEVAFGWIMNLYSAKPGGEVAWIKGTTLMQRNYNEGFTSLIAATGLARSIAAPDRAPIDLVDAVEQSSRDAQTQIAKISESTLISTASVLPSGF